MSLGTFFFILFYSLEIFLFWYFIKVPLLTIAFGILLVLSGFYTIYYARNTRRLFFNFKLYNKKHIAKHLLEERNQLINEFEKIRVLYLEEKNDN